MSGCCCHRSDDELEHGMRARLEAAPDYPFVDVIHEFERRLSLPTKKVVWHRPSLEGLVVSPYFTVMLQIHQQENSF